MWQEDLVSFAQFIHECLEKVYILAAGPSLDDQASDQPDKAGRDVK